MWKECRFFLRRERKTLYTVSLNELEEICGVKNEVRYQREWFPCFGTNLYKRKDEQPEEVFACLIGDPEGKTQLHTQHSSYMWGLGVVELNSSQIEAVRLWQTGPLNDLLLSREA